MIKNKFISIDASNRVWINGVKTYIDPVLPGQVMNGVCVGEVVASNGKYPKGTLVTGLFGWQ